VGFDRADLRIIRQYGFLNFTINTLASNLTGFVASITQKKDQANLIKVICQGTRQFQVLSTTTILPL
jgi:hypothetical protein